MNYLNSIQGYRTYLCAALIGIVSAAHYLGYVDTETFQTLTALITGGGLAALRSGVSANK